MNQPPPKKIAVFTSTRADYGLLRNLLLEFETSSVIQTQLIVTGTHLSQQHGMTINEIRKDGFDIHAEIPIPAGEESPLSIAHAASLALDLYAQALEKLSPDIVVVLGDRYEIASAALAALYMQIPIAHLHGGERSEGVIDEALRHSITKTAYWHFCAAEEYRNRIIQLGEHPDRVFNVGALGLDSIKNLEFLDISQLEADLDVSLAAPLFVVTYHPISTSLEVTKCEIQALCKVLASQKEATIIITGVNADSGATLVRQEFETLQKQKDPKRFLMVENLGQVRYFSLLSMADCVLGNSSSGVIEAPFLGVPAINIGERQRGRLKAKSQIDCPGTYEAISHALDKARDQNFRNAAFKTLPPLGNGTSAKQINRILENCTLSEDTLKKTFYDLP